MSDNPVGRYGLLYKNLVGEDTVDVFLDATKEDALRIAKQLAWQTQRDIRVFEIIALEPGAKR